MRKYKQDLKSGLFKVVVSGTLTFTQDLIHSKIVSNNYFENRADEDSMSNGPKAINWKIQLKLDHHFHYYDKKFIMQLSQPNYMRYSKKSLLV